MSDLERRHQAIVDACIERVTNGAPPGHFVLVLSQVVNSLWQRSLVTLSDITLAAIFDRTLRLSIERFPFFAQLKVERTGPHVDQLIAQDDTVSDQQWVEAFRYFFVTLLTLFGNLTADILLKSLYQELETVVPKFTRPDFIFTGFTPGLKATIPEDIDLSGKKEKS